MIHKNRGNRRWIDKRKRRYKYNLAKVLCDKTKGVLGKYDKGHIYDINSNKDERDYDDYYQDGLSRSDKRKIESCNGKLKDYDEGWHEIDTMIIADCEDYVNSEGEGND